MGLRLPFLTTSYSALNKHLKIMKNYPIKRIRPLGFQWATLDPFLFCVHHEDHYPKGNEKLGPAASLEGRNLGQDFVLKDGWRMYHGKEVPGFPGHPHVGFETITVVRQGFVDHSDSLGAAGRYGNGDVQWMTAGSGVQHAEMFPLLNKESENRLELFQIWLNLPGRSKSAAPHFKMYWNEYLPRFSVNDANGKTTFVEVLAGTFNNKTPGSPPPDSWAAIPEHAVGVFAVKMEAGSQWQLSKSFAGVNRSLYFFRGEGLYVEGQLIASYNAVDVDSAYDILVENRSLFDVEILILQGKPIGEAVVQHGPFVGNSRADIQEAFQRFNQTQFGGWPWPGYEHVHSPERGRFAFYADGSEEFPG